jgi:hypothetical protein
MGGDMRACVLVLGVATLGGCTSLFGLGGNDFEDNASGADTAEKAALGAAGDDWGGTATVVVGDAWSGQCTEYVTSGSDTVCAWQWDVASTAVRQDCADCDFAFDLALTGGHQVDGDCSAAGFEAETTKSWGYAPSFSYDDTASGSYYDNSSVLVAWDGQQWWPLAAATWDGTTLTFGEDM